MRARKTPSSNAVIGLAGGTEDNDLWARVGRGYEALADDDPGKGMPYIASVWEPSPAERAAIATGNGNLELVILGETQPPVMLNVTREQPTANRQRLDNDPRIWLELPRPVAVDVIAAINVSRYVPLGAGGPLLGPGPLERLEQLRSQLEHHLATLNAQEPPA